MPPLSVCARLARLLRAGYGLATLFDLAKGRDMEDPPNTGRFPMLSRSLPALAVLAAAVAGFVLLRDHLRFDTLHDHHLALIEFRDAHYLRTVVFFMLAYVALVLSALPALAATLMGGFLFGLFPGVILNIVAATTGATLLFLAVKGGLGTWIAPRLVTGQGAMARAFGGIRENEVMFLLALRILPGIPFALGNVLPAMMGVRLRRFVVTTAAGSFPATFVYTWVGAGLGEILMQDDPPDADVLADPFVMGALVALALIALVPMAFLLWRRRRAG